MAGDAPARIIHRGEDGDRAFEYWLGQADGFRVESPAGRLGVIEEIRRSGDGQPATLVVRAGRLGRRLLLIPAVSVDAIVPAQLRLLVEGPVALSGTEPRRLGLAH